MAWNPFGRLFRKAMDEATYAILRDGLSSPNWTPPASYEKIAKEAYINNAVAFRCIDLISRCATALPYQIRVRDEQMEKHDVEVLLTSPNLAQSNSSLMKELYTYLMLAGNAYLYLLMVNGKPEEIHILRPDRVKVRKGANGSIVGYEYTVQDSQSTRVFHAPQSRDEQGEVLHLKTIHPLKDSYGLAPIVPAARNIDINSEALKFQMSLLQNSARPSGAFIMKAEKDGGLPLSEDVKADLKEQIVNMAQGSKNAGRPLLLEGGLDWKEMGQTPQEMDFQSGNRDAMRGIALALGVPPMLLGIPGDNTYANYKEANRAFYRQTVIPLARSFYDDLSRFFSPTYPDIEIEADLSDVAALSVEREESYKTIGELDFLTVNEKREKLGFEPIDGGDVVLVDSTKTPLEEAGMESEAPVEEEEEEPEQE